jgi:cytochrome c oxidase assembly protein subunit 15
LCCATFPLIWIGGLVTTHDAGMAVPDWPNTYGYNLFLYPYSEWFSAPWDLFIEHGHRLLAAAVGLLTIALVVVVWRKDDRRWMRGAAIVALALVIAQGVLGGLRVLFDARTFAMIHGCVGPVFFTYCVLLATLTSRRWRQASPSGGVSENQAATAIAIALLAYAQLVLGAQLRHAGESLSPATFRTFVVFHLVVAALLVASIVTLTIKHRASPSWLRRPSWALLALVVVQVLLGVGAWIVNYGWPAWFENSLMAAAFTVQAKGQIQADVTTAHVAFGSLILATSAMVALRSWRLVDLRRVRVSMPLGAGATA